MFECLDANEEFQRDKQIGHLTYPVQCNDLKSKNLIQRINAIFTGVFMSVDWYAKVGKGAPEY